MKLTKLFILGAFSTLMFTACKDDKKAEETEIEVTDETNIDTDNNTTDEVDTKRNREDMNLAEVTRANTNLSSVSEALERAGLVAKLEADTPVTIFAPTDAAFDKIPQETRDSWMKPENKEKLTGLLSYHIFPGELTAEKLVDLINNAENNKYTFVTANNGEVSATIENGSVVLWDNKGTKTTIETANISASNGYIHTIDNVMMRE
ncbi:fasciclin domain-containing protein [Mesonia sp. K7]|uniref:fasciclin domain-containing protein n=1 Tax=Mesonia sp. K7 TaxID=2218606 RepID=UPI000DA7F7E4|nr:fasciclin domain-containing protein [Mesonia sp. K7]PZD76785.1 hypothetical protein DNG35_11020 [Mesonia sp. K7]